jgi:hypothetical protein
VGLEGIRLRSGRNYVGFLELIRSNQELGNEYIENDLMTPTVEEIRDARPLAGVLPQRVMARATLVATTFCITLPHDLPN